MINGMIRLDGGGIPCIAHTVCCMYDTPCAWHMYCTHCMPCLCTTHHVHGIYISHMCDCRHACEDANRSCARCEALQGSIGMCQCSSVSILAGQCLACCFHGHALSRRAQGACRGTGSGWLSRALKRRGMHDWVTWFASLFQISVAPMLRILDWPCHVTARDESSVERKDDKIHSKECW